MRKRLLVFGIATAVVVVAVAAIILASGSQSPLAAPAAGIDPAEHARAIEALRPPKRARPVIAILALNDATEITDLMVPFGVLSRARVGEVSVVAERAEPIPLHPFSKLGQGPALLRIAPHSTAAAFDARYPDGADYVVVPAMEPRNNPFVTRWIAEQHGKGATIVSVCAGSLTIAAAGLLDGRRATTHWAYVEELQEANPTMQWVPDLRYVVDRGVSTSTGITATLPVTVSMVEAIAGRAAAEGLAQDLGLPYWDARHQSAVFALTWEHQKTFMRNWLAVWNHQTIGVPVDQGVDEIALALTADAHSRTASSSVVTIGRGPDAVRSKHGLMIHPNALSSEADVDRMLPAPRADSPALAIERELNDIAGGLGPRTAEIVALVLEYPWSGNRESRETKR